MTRESDTANSRAVMSAGSPPASPGWHVDTEALKRHHPIEGVVASYGIALRPSGRTLVGRCPFHQDRGRANLCLFPDSESFFCFRCGAGGDVITFVRCFEGIDFRDAVERLCGGQPPTHGRVGAVPSVMRPAPGPLRRLARLPGQLPTLGRRLRGIPRPNAPLGAAERACLDAAVELYHNRLLTDAGALDYIRGRGVSDRTLRAQRVGFAAGDGLAEYLRWRRLPLAAARRAGLLRPNGREFLAGRVVVPELRHGRAIWAIGRLIDPQPRGPTYLGLPGQKPLLGWEAASAALASAGDDARTGPGDLRPWPVGTAVCVTEGVVDWLVLCGWGIPAVALAGTYVRPDQVAALGRFPRLYLVLDNDGAGREASAALQEAFGERARTVALPGVKDVGDLAVLRDGRRRFHAALREATTLPPAAAPDGTPQPGGRIARLHRGVRPEEDPKGTVR